MNPRTPDQRRDADQRGREGEAEAAMFLAQAGWRIVAERVKTKAGEIDLIARKPGLIAFVEVKWRARAAQLGDAIDERRLARVAAAVEMVWQDYATQGEDIRIDVILLAPGSKPTHIENAWMPFG
ncbi:YraN family protein [Erythrobacter sp. BLCC-B19]|uniref:YraN family protein n=1 Tax=Erythrobacter sp. BLCC-B19 TaxID=3025315 RepID=UPI00235F1378|nr:YraN family protein [Erythrobacter sp. BLCC-B19]WDA40650.1 YraN family protein [Erythrobacter sp. BLCC-B19]